MDAERLSDDDVREVRKLVLRHGGLKARRWLVAERGYPTDVAKRIVDPFLDEDVATALPAWDLFRGLLLLAIGVGISAVAYSSSADTSGEGVGPGTFVLFWGAIVVGGFLAARGLWSTARYVLARWRG